MFAGVTQALGRAEQIEQASQMLLRGLAARLP